ncbi:hypothetical protein OTU49_014419, partial [Cherax quadricarinatus]
HLNKPKIYYLSIIFLLHLSETLENVLWAIRWKIYKRLSLCGPAPVSSTADMTGVLVKTCLLGALALTLLHSGAQAQCDNVEIINEWEDNYQADFNAPAPIDIEDLSVEMTFSRPVDEIVNYSGDVTKIDDYHFILTFPGVNLNAGDNIMYRFQVVYPSFLPLVVTEVVNGVEIC